MSSKPSIATKTAGQFLTAAELNEIVDFFATKPDSDEVESPAQLNARDANNRNRANHIGTQVIATILGLQAALDAKSQTGHEHTASQITDLQAAIVANLAVALNTAKVGITPAQALAIIANTAKEGITSAQASAIVANTDKVGNVTHTGEVTGSGALTIAPNAVTLEKLAPAVRFRVLKPEQSQATSIGTDFYSNISTQIGIGLGVFAMGGGTLVSVDAEINHPGLVVFRSTANVLTGYAVSTIANVLLISGGEKFQVVFKPRNVHATTTLRMGFWNFASTNVSSDGVYLESVGDETNVILTGILRVNNVEVRTSTTATLSNNTWYMAEFFINENRDSVTFKVFDEQSVLVWESLISANVTQVPVRIAVLAFSSVLSIQDLVTVDMFEMSNTVGLKRGGMTIQALPINPDNPDNLLGATIFSDNFDNGVTNWENQGEFNSSFYGFGSTSLSTEQSFSGDRSLKLVTLGRDVDGYAQSNNMQYNVANNGDDIIIRSRLYLTDRIGFFHPAGEYSFFNYLQFKAQNAAQNLDMSVFGLYIEAKGVLNGGGANFMGLIERKRNEADDLNSLYHPPLLGTTNAIEIPIGQWVEFRIRIRINDGAGIIQVWQDNVKIHEVLDARTFRADQGITRLDVSLGNYQRFARMYANGVPTGVDGVTTYNDDFGIFEFNSTPVDTSNNNDIFGSTLFSDNFDNGEANWNLAGEFNTSFYGFGSYSLSTEQKFSGTHSLKMTTNGKNAGSDWHAQSNSVQYGFATNGDDLVIRTRIYLPHRVGFHYPNGEYGFFEFLQYKGAGAGSINHPLFGVFVNAQGAVNAGGANFLSLSYFGGQWGDPSNTGFGQLTAEPVLLPIGQWVTIDMRLKLNDGQGIVQVYQDGVKIIEVLNARTWRNDGGIDRLDVHLSNYGRYHRAYLNGLPTGLDGVDIYHDDFGIFQFNSDPVAPITGFQINSIGTNYALGDTTDSITLAATVGELMVVISSAANLALSTINTRAGWTLVADRGRTKVFTKVKVSGDPTVITFTKTGSGVPHYLVAFSVSGSEGVVNLVSPAVSSDYEGNLVIPSLANAPTTEALAIAFAGSTDTTTSPQVYSAGWTRQVRTVEVGYAGVVSFASKPLPSGGATGAVTITEDSNSQGLILVIRRA